MKILVQPHSIVDIITNSSTEIFIGQRGHSEELVRSIVEQVCKAFHRDFNDMEISISTDRLSDHYFPVQAGMDGMVVVISVERYLIPHKMTKLLQDIFETGAENDDNN